jgi:DNA replication protein DnaC
LIRNQVSRTCPTDEECPPRDEECPLYHRIFFIACHDLVARFRKAVRYDRVDRLLATVLRPRLLILDEIGYTPLDRAEATFLFEVVAKRYDRCKPMIVTSSKSWGAWGEIFPDQVMTAAILDRLLHRSVTINIQGESYRLRAHRKAGLNPSPWIDQKGGPETPSDVSNQVHLANVGIAVSEAKLS